MLDLTAHWAGYLSLLVFFAAYALVVFEEATGLRKSKPVMLAAGLIWALIGIAYLQAGLSDRVREPAVHIIEEYAELFLFLLVGLALRERGAPDPLSSWSIEQDHKRAALRLATTSEAIKAAEADLETKVTAYLGTLPFLCLPVDNDPDGTSARGLIERNSIALLSNFGKPRIDATSATWLGRDCKSGRIAAAELWNDGHVEVVYDPAFLDAFERHIPA